MPEHINPEVVNLNIYAILTGIMFCAAPAGVLWCCRRSRWLGKAGPVLLLYLLGIVLGNIGFLHEPMAAVQTLLSNAAVPLAIPLMLFGCRLRYGTTRRQLLALLTGLVSVVVTVTAGYLLLGRNIEQGARIGGMLTGVYTGGTINLAALKAMLGVSDSTYILLNSYDMLVSFLYLTFLLSVGIKLFRRILPQSASVALPQNPAAVADSVSEPRYGVLLTKEGLRSAAGLLGAALLICAVSGGAAMLLPQSMFMTAFILLLTTLSLACSFIKRVRNAALGYDMGMYLIYIFCIAVASMADLSEFNLAGGVQLLAYLALVVFGSLLLQALLAAIFRLDADTVIIASVAFINSPPFVPMVAGAMKNRDVLVTGLSIGIVGYAVGNYLGFAMAGLLGRF